MQLSAQSQHPQPPQPLPSFTHTPLTVPPLGEVKHIAKNLVSVGIQGQDGDMDIDTLPRAAQAAQEVQKLELAFEQSTTTFGVNHSVTKNFNPD